jgi:hypothetical protein
MPSHAGQPAHTMMKGFLCPDLIWGLYRFDRRCLRQKMLNNPPVMADGVVAAPAFDKFSHDMNHPTQADHRPTAINEFAHMIGEQVTGPEPRS